MSFILSIFPLQNNEKLNHDLSKEQEKKITNNKKLFEDLQSGFN